MHLTTWVYISSLLGIATQVRSYFLFTFRSNTLGYSSVLNILVETFSQKEIQLLVGRRISYGSMHMYDYYICTYIITPVDRFIHWIKHYSLCYKYVCVLYLLSIV